MDVKSDHCNFATETESPKVKFKLNKKNKFNKFEITLAEAKEALKLARGIFDDGITFEIHSYVNPNVATEQIWNWLKTVKLPSTKTSQWPQDGEISTHVRGQVSSAYHMDEMIHFDERP